MVVIFILPYDPFGKNRMLYTIENHCKEEPDMDYDDGSLTYFIYTKGEKEIPSKELKNMLSFLENSTEENAVTNDLKAVRGMIENIKLNQEIGVKYMHTWERERQIKAMAYEEGVDAGTAIGVEMGAEQNKLSLIKRKLAKGKTIPTIADEIEEDIETVNELIEKYSLK